ncbi:MAG: U32 family peptidase [Desulfobacterales bacterium]|nr:U32 family peptidase [Desulfobacterales bacterium]
MPKSKTKKIELLAPAGNFEKLEIAIHYGADAVYLGGKDFSLRNLSGNFSLEEIKQAVAYAHDRGVKIYVTVNVYARNDEQPFIAAYLEKLGAVGPDGVIVADPGVILTARELMPHIPLHLSTQANSTNYKTVEFWERLGIRRVNVARELTLAEIQAIGEQAQIEIEAFVHGAMCIAYSGRCLLSSFMTNRHSNRGMCTHPCRWKYALVEETRAGLYMPIAEDNRGTYIFNSKDLCMIEHIPALINSSVSALKIEGRMKGINYLATVVKVYREAIDRYFQDPMGYDLQPEWLVELTRINRRGFCTGFYFDDPQQTVPDYDFSMGAETHLFIGKVLTVHDGRALMEVRNKCRAGDRVEILSPRHAIRNTCIGDMQDEEGRPIQIARSGTRVYPDLGWKAKPNDLIRKLI